MATPEQGISKPVHPSRLIKPYDGPRSLSEQIRMAEYLATARTGVPRFLVGDSGGIFAYIQRAIDLDIGLTVAMDNLLFGANGACAMRARLLMALLTVRAGHRVVVDPARWDDKHAVAVLTYSEADGRPPFEINWTAATAQKAKLFEKSGSPWVAYTSTMLYWRAVAAAVSQGCPEVLAGVGCIEAGDLDYLYKEIPTATDADGRPVPDERTVEILDEIPTPAPDGRPILRVETSIDDLRKAWVKAGKEVRSRFAWHNGDDALTLEHVLFDLIEQATARDVAIAATAEPTPQPEGLDTPAGTPVTLPCGCDTEQVTATGMHRDECPDRGAKQTAS